MNANFALVLADEAGEISIAMPARGASTYEKRQFSGTSMEKSPCDPSLTAITSAEQPTQHIENMRRCFSMILFPNVQDEPRPLGAVGAGVWFGSSFCFLSATKTGIVASHKTLFQIPNANLASLS